MDSIITARIRRMGKVMFWGGQGQRSIQPRGGQGQRSIQPGGVRSSWGGQGQRSIQPGGSGPARGGGSKVNPARGGQVQLGGSKVNPAGGGQVQLGGKGGSASCALLRAVCLLRSRRRTFLLFLDIKYYRTQMHLHLKETTTCKWVCYFSDACEDSVNRY